MKKNIITFFTLLCINDVYSQKLFSSDLQYVLTHSLDEVEMFLSSKGFGFDQSNNSTSSCQSITWLNKEKVRSNFDIYFLSRNFCQETSLNLVLFSFYNRAHYNNLKSEIVKRGFKATSSTVDSDDYLKIVYSNYKYIVEFYQKSNTDIDLQNTYRIILRYK